MTENRLSLKIDAIEEQRFTDAFQKVAIRITAGIIIVAALIIGAPMLVRIPSSWILMAILH